MRLYGNISYKAPSETQRATDASNAPGTTSHLYGTSVKGVAREIYAQSKSQLTVPMMSIDMPD